MEVLSVSDRYNSDLTFQCIICSVACDNSNMLHEHMKTKHQTFYEMGGEMGAKGMCGEIDLDSESEHELSDEEYLGLSRLLEPICELRQIDEDDIENSSQSESPKEQLNFQPTSAIAQLMQNIPFAAGPVNEEQLRIQLQLQMQLKNYLLQLQMNGGGQQQQQKLPEQPNLQQQQQQPNSNQSDKKLKNRNANKPLILRKYKYSTIIAAGYEFTSCLLVK